jgi:hypothetical protein
MVPSATHCPEDIVSETQELSHPAENDSAGVPTHADRLRTTWTTAGARWASGRTRVEAWWAGLTPRGRQNVTLGAVAGFVVVAGALALLGLVTHSAAPESTASSPVHLPDTVAGLSRLPGAKDVTRSPIWQQRAAAATHGAPFAAGTYGSSGSSRTIRVVVARADLTRKLEAAWAANDGRDVGDDSCTQNLRLTPNSAAGVRPTVSLCWRTGDTLSGYALLIDPKHHVKDADAAKALDQAWDAVAGH